MTEEFRKSAPEPLEALPFRVPEPVEATLSCGLTVVAVHDTRQPLVNFRLVFRTGDINDPEGRTGVSSAMASLINEGTENYSSRELAEAVDLLGADLSASSASDHTVVKASGLAMYAPKILDLFAELVLRPVFPVEELDLYKQNTIEGLKYQRSQPDFLADEQVARIVYGGHPYSVSSPTPDDINSLERQWLTEYHGSTFVPNNAILIAVGDIDPADLFSELEARFGGWEPGDLAEAAFPPFPARSKRTLTIVDRPGSTQANIVLSNIAIDRRSPDYFPVLLMNQVLGAGASSRLFMNLREEKGYTYGAYSRIYAKRFGGSFEATAEVRTAVTGDSLREFFMELERIRSEKVPESELADARDFLTGVFPIRVETQGGLIGQIVAQRLYGLPDDYLVTYCENISAVTADEITRVATLYVHPESIAIVIVGDAEEVLPQAGEFADDIEIFDTEGRPKSLDSFAPGTGEEVDVSGRWDLTIVAQGQELPLVLDLQQDGGVLNGHLESMLGQGSVADGEVSAGRIKGTITTEFQGQGIQLSIKGTVSGDEMSGTVTIPVMPEPMEFTGRRVADLSGQ
jgi:zinc protease